MLFNYCKLKGKIKEKFGTQDNFAKAMDMGRVTLSQTLNNKRNFTQDEIAKACRILVIQDIEIPVYFFCIDCSETRTVA